MPRTLLLHGVHERAGATLGIWNDWIVPQRYGDPDAEYRALRAAAGLLDWSTHGVIDVDGADRVAFLHNLLTNDIKALAPGAGCRAALLGPTARLVAEILVLAGADSHRLLLARERIATVLQTCERYLFTESVALADASTRDAVFALQGPSTLEIIRDLEASMLDLSRPLTHARAIIASVTVTLIAHSLADVPGVAILVPVANAADVWDALLDAGRPRGAAPVGWEALNTLRIEAGVPWHGVDLDDTNLLPETGLERSLVSWTKGCYPGQEIVARMDTYGSASRKLVGLVIEGESPPSRLQPIHRGEEQIGQITSACFSPRVNRAIAMGMVKRPHYEPGTAVEIVEAGRARAAVVVARPFTASGASRLAA